MRRFNLYYFKSWFRYFRLIARQLVIPFAVFQGIRTIFMPTTFDVMLMTILIMLAIAFHLKWI